MKKDFPIFSDSTLVYLDNAATTQKPLSVLKSLSDYYTSSNANIHRGVYKLSEKASQLYDDARSEIASFIHASPEEIVFTSGTTDSLNLLAYTLGSLFGSRKEIVLTELEHHSNLVPWQQLAKRSGYVLRFIPVKKDLTLDYSAAQSLINQKTAVVSFAHISNALGTVNDAAKLVALAHKAGALAIVDGAQSAGHRPVDVKKMDCDFFVFSSHKMYGPMGVGVLYGKKGLLEKLPPFRFGGDMINTVSYADATWASLPAKFEAGTQNVADVVAFAEAVRYLKQVGMEKVMSHEKKLLSYAVSLLKRLPFIELFVPTSSSGIVSFNVKGVHPHDVASLLDDFGVCVRAGHHCAMPLMGKLGVPGTVRASFSLYNDEKDIDKLIQGLSSVHKRFS